MLYRQVLRERRRQNGVIQRGARHGHPSGQPDQPLRQRVGVATPPAGEVSCPRTRPNSSERNEQDVAGDDASSGSKVAQHVVGNSHGAAKHFMHPVRKLWLVVALSLQQRPSAGELELSYPLPAQTQAPAEFRERRRRLPAGRDRDLCARQTAPPPKQPVCTGARQRRPEPVHRQHRRARSRSPKPAQAPAAEAARSTSIRRSPLRAGG